MNLLTRLTSPPVSEERQTLEWYLQEVAQFGGFQYPLGQSQTQPIGVPSESPPNDFGGMVRQVYYRSGIVAACITARTMLISEARFKWRTLSDRKMFGDESLKLLEVPTPNETAGNILARFEQDASLAGNGYRILIDGNLHRVDPGAMHIMLGSNSGAEYEEVKDAPDATIAGYIYWPGGKGGKNKPKVFLPSEVAHYAPEPDPLAQFRGVSWITQILREVDTHRQMTEHKSKFLASGVPPYAIKYPEGIAKGDQGNTRAKDIIALFKEQHASAAANFDAIHLFGGADPVPLGLNFRDLDFKGIQGASETQIASRGRVPAAVLGISEGLAGSALNSGNFGQARRQFGEQYAYPSWRQMCEALAVVAPPPSGSELWYATTDVAFLHEDAKDAADVIATQAGAIRTLIDGGMEADDAVAAVTNGDLSLLVGAHTGLVPVQLQPPGAQTPSAPALTNGAA